MTEKNVKKDDAIPNYKVMKVPNPMQYKWNITPTVSTPEENVVEVDLKTIKNELQTKINSAITKTEAIEALSKVAKSTTCLGTNVAESITEADLDLNSSTSYHYQIFSVVERRIVKYKDKPYKKGDTVDGPDCGTPPQCWEIEVPEKIPVGEKYETTVPHTSVKKQCPKCRGVGHVKCMRCEKSVGRCSLCGGCGFNECETCEWKGKIVRSIELKVKWEVLDNHAVYQQDSNVAEVPAHLLINAAGDNVREIRGTQMLAKDPSTVEWIWTKSKRGMRAREQNSREEMPRELEDAEKRIGLIPPTTDLPNDFLNNKSQVFTKNHKKFYSGLIIRQKQLLRSVPVTRCDYLWRGRRHHFVIYGTENKVLTKKCSSDPCQIV